MSKKIVYISVLLVTLSTFLSIPVKTGETSENTTLTNNDVIKMVKAELSENIVILTIKNSKADFDLSPNGLINLKNNGVSYSIVETMINAGDTSLVVPAPKQHTSRHPQPSVQNTNQTNHRQPMAENRTPLENDEYYARCNLKVFKGSNISWINWQATQNMIPAGTRLRVVRKGKKAILTNVNTDARYTLDVGASGDKFLNKFVTKQPVSIALFPFAFPGRH